MFPEVLVHCKRSEPYPQTLTGLEWTMGGVPLCTIGGKHPYAFEVFGIHHESTETPEEVTCPRCLDNMARQTEAFLDFEHFVESVIHSEVTEAILRGATVVEFMDRSNYRLEIVGLTVMGAVDRQEISSNRLRFRIILGRGEELEKSCGLAAKGYLVPPTYPYSVDVFIDPIEMRELIVHIPNRRASEVWRV